MYKTANSTLKIKYEGIKKLLEKKDKEIEELHFIIKEAREYIEKNWGSYYWTMSDSKIGLLEILDKAGDIKWVMNN